MPARTGGPRSIIYVCDFNAHGGTQTHLLHLFETLDRSRFCPSLVALNLHPDLARRLSRLDLDVEDLRLEGAFRPATLLKTAALGRSARRGRADLIHGCLHQGNILTAVVSRLSGVDCITSVRNLDLWKRTPQRLASAAAHRGARRVVFNSRAVRDYTAAREWIPLTKAVVIYNGVADAGAVEGTVGSADETLFEPGCPTAVCVASLRPKKGHAQLLEAFRRVVERMPEARLVLVGEGPLREGLKATSARLGLGGSTVFAGYRPDIARLLGRAGIFVLASLEEGMPNALLEAMSAGLPAVVTDVGGVAEAVLEGRTGFLVPPGEASALAERMLLLLGDPELRRRQGAEARRRYEACFTPQRMARDYEQLYDEVLAGGSRP